MAQFRKKPVIVEAEQFWPDKPLPFNERGPVVEYDGEFFVITIHNEKAHLAPGDWVILEPRGPINNAYPCKPDIFAANYSPAADGIPVPKAALERVTAWVADWCNGGDDGFDDLCADIIACRAWLRPGAQATDAAPEGNTRNQSP